MIEKVKCKRIAKIGRIEEAAYNLGDASGKRSYFRIKSSDKKPSRGAVDR